MIYLETSVKNRKIFMVLIYPIHVMYELREEWLRTKGRRSFRLFSCNFIFVQCDFIYEVAVLCASYANDNWHEWIHKAIRHMHLNIVKITAYFYKHRYRPTHTHSIDIQKNDRRIDIWPHLTIKNYRFAWNSLVHSVLYLSLSLSSAFHHFFPLQVCMFRIA